MDVSEAATLLEDESRHAQAMASWQLQDASQGHQNLKRIWQHGVTIDLMAALLGQLREQLPLLSDPDMALNNLERFVAASRSPLAFGALLERDRSALPILLRIFSTSQHLSDLLVREPEGFDLLRLTEGQPVARQMLVEDITSETNSLDDERAALAALRRFKHRELLRIAYGDLVGSQRIETITRQLSYVADAVCEAAVAFAYRKLESKRGVPRAAGGKPARYAVLALGKLGGNELNYSSDIDLVMFYDQDGNTDGDRPVSNLEFFERLTHEVIRLLTEATELGTVYRVDMRLRPHGKAGPLVNSLEAMRHYYDVYGRTWERQAYVKARAIAGDLELGQQFLDRLQPWIYRRYLSRADITGIRHLKRRIEHRTLREGLKGRDVKTGHGGIRDVEFAIQFLQLLNGGDAKSLRSGNTLQAIAELADAGCLTMQEKSLLEESYTFLRRVEHRLQILFDLQTHELPQTDIEMRKLAIRLGYVDEPQRPAIDQFREEYAEKTKVNRKILDFLLHDAFPDEDESSPETDLILDPDPTPEFISEVLKGKGFSDLQKAYGRLSALASETIPFLSQRRCRHFLAAIIPHLLESIARTPSPDSTLVTLEQVSDSLGGKGMLWELFSYNPPSMDLYVRLCASSPYLAGILTGNPGMIDELLDSLLVDQLPSRRWLSQTLAELCRGAEDIDPILHSFKNSQHLRVGVRDVLGKEKITETHRALSDIAEALVTQIIDWEQGSLIDRHGRPMLEGDEERECEFIVLGMGKLGGREPNYHSDLDVIFLYEDDGNTQHWNSNRETTNQHLFTQLAVRLMMRVNQVGPQGRLYEMDARLRPTGRSGALVVPLSEFKRYFETGQGQLWERQALCKSRPIYGSQDAVARAMQAVRGAMFQHPWTANDAQEIADMRLRLQQTASAANLKRGKGGTMDIEFAVQMLQLRFGQEIPEVLQPGTLDALEQLRAADVLDAELAEALSDAYRFLRGVEARLRLMNTTARHDLPESQSELEKLAYVLRWNNWREMVERIDQVRIDNRRHFDQIVARLTSDG